MPAPIAKGLMVAASVLVAAGVAMYENPQVRRWVYESRRKLAIALHSLGDEVQPDKENPQSSQRAENDQAKNKTEEMKRRQRLEIVMNNKKNDRRAEDIEKSRKHDKCKEGHRKSEGDRRRQKESNKEKTGEKKSSNHLLDMDDPLSVAKESYATAVIDARENKDFRQRTNRMQDRPDESINSMNPFTKDIGTNLDYRATAEHNIPNCVKSGSASVAETPAASTSVKKQKSSPRLIQVDSPSEVSSTLVAGVGTAPSEKINAITPGSLTPTSTLCSSSPSIAAESSTDNHPNSRLPSFLTAVSTTTQPPITEPQVPNDVYSMPFANVGNATFSNLGVDDDGNLSEAAFASASEVDMELMTPSSWTDVESVDGGEDYSYANSVPGKES